MASTKLLGLIHLCHNMIIFCANNCKRFLFIAFFDIPMHQIQNCICLLCVQCHWKRYLCPFKGNFKIKANHNNSRIRNKHTLSSLLSVLFYQTTWSEFFQKVSIKLPGPSHIKMIVPDFFRAATANFWALLNNLFCIFGDSLY